MSLYALQKAIRDINRRPEVRASFMAAPEEALKSYSLSDEERRALISRDYTRLYRMGVHGLLLRPFSIIHSVAEADYLAAIRKEG